MKVGSVPFHCCPLSLSHVMLTHALAPGHHCVPDLGGGPNSAFELHIE